MNDVIWYSSYTYGQVRMVCAGCNTPLNYMMLNTGLHCWICIVYSPIYNTRTKDIIVLDCDFDVRS